MDGVLALKVQLFADLWFPFAKKLLIMSQFQNSKPQP